MTNTEPNRWTDWVDGIPPLKQLILDETELSHLPEPVNTEIVLSEPSRKIKAKIKLAQIQKKLFSNLLRSNSWRKRRPEAAKRKALN